MNQKIKDYLGLALIVGVLMVALAAWNYARSFEPASYRSFVVNAEGKAAAVPDIAQFTFGVITEGGLEDIEGLKDENARKANAVIDYLKDNDVDKKDIKTLNFNVTPRYTRCYESVCPPQTIEGYTVSQNIQIKVRKLDDAGKLLTGVVEKGANNVSGLRFTIDDPTKVENEAREEAFDKAKKKAEAIAKAGGFRLGKLISIDEGSYGKVGVAYAESRDVGMGGGGEEIQIEPGEQEVRINITLRYEIK